MKIYQVFKRTANSTEKTLVGTFQANSKKEICSKIASLHNGYFISAREIVDLENLPQTFKCVKVLEKIEGNSLNTLFDVKIMGIINRVSLNSLLTILSLA